MQQPRRSGAKKTKKTKKSLRRRAAPVSNEVLPCGLTERQLHELMSREITPEDYELLLGMDSAVEPPPSQLLSRGEVEAFPMRTVVLPPIMIATHGSDAACEAAEGPECGVCLEPFVDGERVRQLPRCCVRAAGESGFHPRCIERWMCESKSSCPLCYHDYATG